MTNPECFQMVVDGQLVTFCPPGIAYGAFEIPSRGMGDSFAAITVWPSPHFRVFTGGESQFRDLNIRGLWQQEIYVYLRELGMACREALAMLREAPKKDVGEICQYCFETFYQKGVHKYCSTSCKSKALAWRQLQMKLVEKALDKANCCLQCQQEIPTSAARRGVRKRFCDNDCRNLFNEQQVRLRQSQFAARTA